MVLHSPKRVGSLRGEKTPLVDPRKLTKVKVATDLQYVGDVKLPGQGVLTG